MPRVASVFYLASILGLKAGLAATPDPPWPAQYKLRADDEARLTAADVVGPDGIVYPDWSTAGVQGGIPRVPTVATLEEFGGKPDGRDISEALTRAVQAIGAKGGGAILLKEGTYSLDNPVTVRHDNIVIRGLGWDKTKILFRYAVPGGLAFYSPAAGARVGPNTQIELHASPARLNKMTINAGEVVIKTWEISQHSGNTFACTVYGKDFLRSVPKGSCTLKGVAEYKDGPPRTTMIQVILDPEFRDKTRPANSQAVLSFQGTAPFGPRLKLASDGRRGDTRLELAESHGFAPGDSILIEGPATQRWKALTRNACQWGVYRRYELQIEAVEGRTIRINQPLRIEFPVVDGSYVQRIKPIQHGGIEDLYLEQTENLWITTVLFDQAWNCWARGVKVRRCGRHPVYATAAKWCEIRDCVFDDAWFKGGGGTAYAGWEKAHDCLMENVETFNLRHAPLVQWSASGCVIRKSVFRNSDAQWHAGWTSENLFEQCVVTSALGNGGYGFGMWASPPNDRAHGPNGPRNVVYNCDVTSPKAGLWMGGMNENWLILHNRFVVQEGPGIIARTCSFDHIIQGNVFTLKSASAPMVQLDTADCVGVEVLTNHVHGGSGKLVSGKASAFRLEGNQTFSLSDAPRPTPGVPSIYEWQKAQKLRASRPPGSSITR